jgi:integrase
MLAGTFDVYDAAAAEERAFAGLRVSEALGLTWEDIFPAPLHSFADRLWTETATNGYADERT